MQPMRILSPQLELLGEVDNYLSFSFTRKYHKAGEFQIVTNLNINNADKLQKDNIIMLDTKKVGIIKHREITINQMGEENLLIRGWELKGITKQRITIPPVGESYHRLNTNTETILKTYMQRNCLDIEGMEFPMLVISEYLSRGNTIAWQTRYKPLEEELERISIFSGMGWYIYLDFDLMKWVFDVFEGRDLTAGQEENPPVIFSTDFDNIKSQEYVDSLLGYANYAIVAGEGQGTNRKIVEVETDKVGLDRYVTFVDARDIGQNEEETLTEEEIEERLINRGQQRLSELEKINTFSAEILTYSPLKYEKDWDLGDIVTVQNKKWGVTLDTRITAVTEIYEVGGFRLDVIFGEDVPTLQEKLKQELDGINNEVAK